MTTVVHRKTYISNSKFFIYVFEIPKGTNLFGRREVEDLVFAAPDTTPSWSESEEDQWRAPEMVAMKEALKNSDTARVVELGRKYHERINRREVDKWFLTFACYHATDGVAILDKLRKLQDLPQDRVDAILDTTTLRVANIGGKETTADTVEELGHKMLASILTSLEFYPNQEGENPEHLINVVDHRSNTVKPLSQAIPLDFRGFGLTLKSHNQSCGFDVTVMVEGLDTLRIIPYRSISVPDPAMVRYYQEPYKKISGIDSFSDNPFYDNSNE